jgi:demethylmenaquinone methyltransferase/2-methoxy-6-polyprenyl-1,4-benzoquinol methylase
MQCTENNMTPHENEAIAMLQVLNPLREPVLREAIRALHLPAGSHGLDAGCGIGQQSLLLADAVGVTGHVTGLDLSAPFLARAASIAREAGLSSQITFCQGDAGELPFAANSFAWAWSVDCVGYAPFDPMPALRAMVRVVKPGGTIALLAWSSESLLPGYPLLEARLKATAVGLAPFSTDRRPGQHFLRGLGWLRDAGLVKATARTFAGDAHAPLDQKLYDALSALLGMRWSGAEAELAPPEQATYRRLTRPGSPDFLLRHPDYYAFFTYTLLHGTVPA